jgi:hypothetical protein
MDFIDVRDFGSVDLIERRLDGLDLQHTIGYGFTF